MLIDLECVKQKFDTFNGWADLVLECLPISNLDESIVVEMSVAEDTIQLVFPLSPNYSIGATHIIHNSLIDTKLLSVYFCHVSGSKEERERKTFDVFGRQPNIVVFNQTETEDIVQFLIKNIKKSNLDNAKSKMEYLFRIMMQYSALAQRGLATFDQKIQTPNNTTIYWFTAYENIYSTEPIEVYIETVTEDDELCINQMAYREFGSEEWNSIDDIGYTTPTGYTFYGYDYTRWIDDECKD